MHPTTHPSSLLQLEFKHGTKMLISRRTQSGLQFHAVDERGASGIEK